MKLFKKYFRLWISFAKASFIADLEFRANFLIRLLTDVFWYIAQVMTFEALYTHTDKIGTWNLAQARVFLGVVFVVDGLYMVLFHDNIEKLTERARKGDLDLLLTKPINSQFMLSCQKVGTVLLGNLAIGIAYLTWALLRYEDLQSLRLGWLTLLIPSGVLCFYSMRFIVASCSLLFTKAESLQYLWYQIYKLALRPDSIYSPWLKFLLLTVIPVGLIASVPARSILDQPEPWFFAYAVTTSGLMLYLSHRFWNFCLKNYSSASS